MRRKKQKQNHCHHGSPHQAHHHLSNTATSQAYIPNSSYLTLSNDQREESQKLEDEVLEAINYFSVLSSFAAYEIHSFHHLMIRQNYFGQLSEERKQMVHGLISARYNLQRKAFAANYNLILKLLPRDHVGAMEVGRPRGTSTTTATTTSVDGSSSSQDAGGVNEQIEGLYPRRISIKVPPHLQKGVKVSDEDVDKVHSTLKAIMRDWSTEGSTERNDIYQPILNALVSHFGESAPTPESRSQIRVITPGCGLARLTWEIARLGFNCQGNEYSFYMLLAANFILNEVTQKDQYVIHPFVHQSINLTSAQDQLCPVSIPDVNPLSLNELLPTGKTANLSMVAGDFIEVYSDDNYASTFDCVVTCFFIDTAKNIFDYIDVIHRILKKGGLWINLGPLLYHYAEMPNTFSIELTYEELRQVIVSNQRFEIKEENCVDSTYCNNPRSMLQATYRTIFFQAIKL